MVGRTIGKYRVVAKLGRGGMGTVYRAVDETLDREVAIKILNPEFADSDVMKRFRAEASMLAKLNHPAIATIYELHRSDEDLLMVMEFVPGESLDQFVQRNGPVEPERAAYLLAQVLDAIGHAHAAGIIHRDLKPSNVMVTERGAVKIMDFGIARVRGAEHMTTDGYMMGTPAYMSPEQVLCQEVDGRSDLYSVGVMFYRLLTAKLPFEADTAIGMVQKQISDAPTPARLHRADLPAWAVAIVDRALAKSPADRYQTAEELRKALLDAIHDAAVEAKTLVLPSPAGGRARWAAARGPDPNAETSIAAAPPRPAPTEFVVAPARRVAPAATPSPTPSLTSSATPIAAKDPAAAATPTAMPADIVPPVAAVPPPMSTEPTPRAAAPVAVSPTHAPKPVAVARTSGSSRVATRAAVALVTVAILAIVIVAWRRSQTPAPTPSASANTAVSSPAAAPPAAAADSTPAPAAAEPTTPPATPALSPAPPTPAVDTAARTSSATPPGTTLPLAGTRPPRAARGATPPPPEPPAAPAPEEPPPPVVVATTPPKPVVAPVQFRAKILVKEDDKSRERDATVRLAEGQVTVTGPDRAILGALPYEAVLSVIYSKSKQPLWDGPAGATPIQQVDGGAFGFLKGGRHWVSLRTKERFIVLRVDENQVASVLSLIEERTGKTTVRVAEPKGNQ
jgi:serine/threonine protein kinase